MEVFESQGDGKSKLTFMYIYGGAYCHQFSKFNWKYWVILQNKLVVHSQPLMNH